MDYNLKFQNRSVFISILLCGLIGFVYSGHIIFRCRILHIFSIIIGFLPLGILIYRNVKFHKNGLASINVITPLVIFLIAAIFLFNGFITSILDKKGHVTNVNSYNKLLAINNYPKNEKIEHFPSEIPKYAKDISLEEWENLYEGSGGFYLKFTYDDKSKVNKYINQINEKCIYIGSLCSSSEEIIIPSLVSNKLRVEENDDVRIYIIDSTPEIKVTNGYCYGIAINKSSSQVLFFKESW